MVQSCCNNTHFFGGQTQQMQTQPTPAPWEQLLEESAAAYQAFEIYRGLGPRRTTRAVAAKLKKSPSLIFRWSSRHCWVVRARAWDRAEWLATPEGERAALLEMERLRMQAVEAKLAAMKAADTELRRRFQKQSRLRVTPEVRALVDTSRSYSRILPRLMAMRFAELDLLVSLLERFDGPGGGLRARR